jgi:hypothetical protein
MVRALFLHVRLLLLGALLLAEGPFFVVVGVGGQQAEATVATGGIEQVETTTADFGTTSAANANVNTAAAAAAARSAASPPPPAGAAARREDSSQSSAAVRELTSLLLKGQTLLLEVAEKQQIQEQNLGVEGEGEGAGGASSVATAQGARPQTSTRVTSDTLAFDDAAAAVDAVLSGFLSDLVAKNGLGAVVSAQGSDDSDENNTANDDLLKLDDDDTNDDDGSDGTDGGGRAAAEEHLNSTAGRPGCLPAVYAAPARQPAKLLGGALAIIFNGGECRVVTGLFPGVRKIECDSPSIEYAWVPPGFEWAHDSPEMWAGESCAGETTRCGSAGATTSLVNGVDVPLTDADAEDPAAGTALCRAASKDSLIDSVFEEDAVLFKAIL